MKYLNKLRKAQNKIITEILNYKRNKQLSLFLFVSSFEYLILHSVFFNHIPNINIIVN